LPDLIVILASSLTRDRQKCQDRPVTFYDSNIFL